MLIIFVKLWLKEIDYLFRCPYPVTNIVYGISKLLNFLVDTYFKKSKLSPKDEDANIW